MVVAVKAVRSHAPLINDFSMLQVLKPLCEIILIEYQFDSKHRVPSSFIYPFDDSLSTPLICAKRLYTVVQKGGGR